MRAIIKESTIQGSIQAPPSKSMAHRLIIAASLGIGTSKVHNIAMSEDIKATVSCMRALGAEIKELREEDAACHADRASLEIKGTDPRQAASAAMNCRECGSTLRFLIPIAALSDKEIVFTGSETLLSRPLGVYEDIFRSQGLRFDRSSSEIKVKGRLSSGEFEIPGDISSQFASGLMMALPLADKDSIIRLRGNIESRPYIEMSIAALGEYGINIMWQDERSILVPGAQKYEPAETTAEGDWSNAAYLMALGTDVKGLDDNSLQGDKVCTEHFEALRQGFAEIDIRNCPDLGPALMAYAAMRRGCRLTGTGRLKIKESDRGAAMKKELEKSGGRVEISDDSIEVSAGLRAPADVLSSHNDHRIAMALSAICLRYGGIIDGAEAVSKSYPDFWEEISKAGADIRLGY